MNMIRQEFLTVDQKNLDAAIASADKKVKAAKIEKRTHTKGGSYNGLPLPSTLFPSEIAAVTDAGKEGLKWQLTGETIVAIGRNFVAPVVIEYVSAKERALWTAAMIVAVRKELEK